MKLSKDNYLKARDFILTNARMIERRLFHFHFENDGPEGVFHAVYAYRNPDGGFGHGMEPDTASPESQPLFSIMALETLDEVDYLTKEIILNDFMPYFKSITTEKGGIPWMLRPKSSYPCEEHFKTVKEWAALSTTAPLLGILEKYKIDIPWKQKAEQFVWSEFDRIKEKHVFCYLCVPRWLTFLKYTKSQEKAQGTIKNLKNWILTDGVICKDTSDTGWGLYGKPHSLNYATSPQSILHSLFTEETIESDLNELINKQQEDGRWDTWYGISDGTKLEWAGIQTLWTLKTLKNYNRIEK
ncbi:hypothetical protein L0P88_23380 [Muricauda sp. SCSIO 64092]|uniref:hypothetical protein n=1 Tax=Allomuricauda sp. SCSIO 64092 TaxID=2908842 RepID=UPI001FF27BC4|nr:hypothetical protein [Muricauda sp. SCSIO 64092]UOY06847.1 hypothetical protein L0P88_23380 [Muricauda sp. SCSIO 64092]